MSGVRFAHQTVGDTRYSLTRYSREYTWLDRGGTLADGTRIRSLLASASMPSARILLRSHPCSRTRGLNSTGRVRRSPRSQTKTEHGPHIAAKITTHRLQITADQLDRESLGVVRCETRLSCGCRKSERPLRTKTGTRNANAKNELTTQKRHGRSA